MYNKHFKRRKRRELVILFFIIILLLLSVVVMLLWNAILPPLLHVNTISYPQSIGLLVLCRILFGGFRFGIPGRPPFDPGNQWRNKWMSMSDEEKAKFRNEWGKRCHPRPPQSPPPPEQQETE